MSFTGMREMGCGEDRQLKVWAFYKSKNQGLFCFICCKFFIIIINFFGEMTKMTLWIVRGYGVTLSVQWVTATTLKKGMPRGLRTEEGSLDLES